MGFVKCTCGEIVTDGFDWCPCCDKDFDGKEEYVMEDFTNLIQYNNSSLLTYYRNINGLYIASMNRSESIVGKTKEISEKEAVHENFNIFDTNKYQLDFKERFIKDLGEDKYKRFCKILINNWKDGYKKRTNSNDILELKSAIYEYLKIMNSDNIYYMSQKPNFTSNGFSKNDIKKILNINEKIFQIAIEDWIDSHSEEFSTNDVYFRRGINAEFNDKDLYFENDFINSYTLSITIAEQFSQTGSSKRSIISGEFGVFYDRILFFAPFIEGLEGQLEIGIIPHVSPLYLEYSGTIDAIDEFILMTQ